MTDLSAAPSTRRRRPVAGAPISPDEPAVVSKRSLVAVSHAIEAAVLNGPMDHPTVIVALFQRLAYFEREYAVYDALARAGAHVVVAFTDGEAHHTPDGVHTVILDPDEPLSDEWTVVAIGPEAGAFLVATDTGEIDPTEQSLEAGRCFVGRWSYSRVQAGNELARMRAGLGERLGPALRQTIDELLTRVMPPGGAAASSRGTTGEQWATAAVHRMTARMQDARAGSRVLRAQLGDAHAAAEARAGANVEPRSGLPTPEFLARWAGTSGHAGALPVGIAVLDVPALEGGREEYGDRRAYHAARQVAAALTEPLGPVDAAVRLSDREFALVVPGASTKHLLELASAAAEQLELFSGGYPHISLSARVATTVTLARPLPLDDLHLALGHPAHSDQQPTTLSGDRIAIAESRELARPAAVPGDDQAAAGTGRWFEPTDPSAGRRAVRPSTAEATDMPRVRVPARPTTAGPDAADGPATDGIELPNRARTLAVADPQRNGHTAPGPAGPADRSGRADRSE